MATRAREIMAGTRPPIGWEGEQCTVDGITYREIWLPEEVTRHIDPEDVERLRWKPETEHRAAYDRHYRLCRKHGVDPKGYAHQPSRTPQYWRDRYAKTRGKGKGRQLVTTLTTTLEVVIAETERLAEDYERVTRKIQEGKMSHDVAANIYTELQRRHEAHMQRAHDVCTEAHQALEQRRRP